jgi:hypothetical protein
MARDAFFECDGIRPRTLALWTRRQLGLGPEFFKIEPVLEHFGLGLDEVEDLPRASALRLVEGQLRVQVRRGSSRQQRYNACHELGHYLLAAHANVSFTRQVRDSRFESYCNRYASNLLLPRPWLRDLVQDQEIHGRALSLSLAADVADLVQVSLLTTVIALNEACGWNKVAVLWQSRAGHWAPSNVIGPDCGLVDAAPETASFLNNVGQSTLRGALPLVLSGRPVEVAAEVITAPGGCVSIFDRPHVA